MRAARLLLAAAAFVPCHLNGWGPHPEIVDAALAALPASDQRLLVATLGPEARKLRFLVWMGDFGNQFESWNEGWGPAGSPGSAVQFYANDYLLFPRAPRLYQHEMPDVKNTFAPFFRRSLEALETESPMNAARWIGSLLHFTTDTGSPPHAAGIHGEVHSKMENWISGSAISITPYNPIPLGEDESMATEGFENRMQKLIDFSRQRAERLKPFVDANNRAACEPIVLESANESARVTADLLHTLMFLWERNSRRPRPAGAVEALVVAPEVENFESIPAKLMLSNSNYSTASEFFSADHGLYRGVFLLREIPPGAYTAIVSRVGGRAYIADRIQIRNKETARFEWRLDADSIRGNIVRNPDFRVRWSGSGPDNWRFDGTTDTWVSDNVKVAAGRRYRAYAPAASGAKIVWFKNHWQPAAEPIAIEAPSMELTAPENAAYARILITSKAYPDQAKAEIALAAERR